MGAHIECHASGSQSFNPTRKTNLCARRYRSTVFQVNAAAHDNLSFVVNVPLHFFDADRFDDGHETLLYPGADCELDREHQAR